MTKNIIIVILVIVVALFVFFNIWREHPAVTDERQHQIDSLENQIKQKQDLIEWQAKIADSLYQANDQLNEQYDSLDNVKQKVKHEYHEVYVYIKSATNMQLDSIVRANW